jgi:hypothetical protein
VVSLRVGVLTGCVALACGPAVSESESTDASESSDATADASTSADPVSTSATESSSGTEESGAPVECAQGEGICLPFAAAMRCYCPETATDVVDLVRTMEAADVDGDGSTDVVAGALTGVEESTQILLLLGGSDGLGQAQEIGQVEERLGDIGLGDLDEDGVLDVVAATIVQSDVTVMLSSGGDVPAELSTIVTGFEHAPLVALGDVDDDAHLDLVTVSFGGLARVDATVWRGNGDGTWAEPVTTLVAEEAINAFITLDIVDLDLDGVDDLFTMGNQWVPGVAGGAGMLGPATWVNWYGVPELEDADGDEHVDALLFQYGGDYQPETIPVTAERGSGGGAFAATQEWVFPGDEPVSGLWGDVDDDGAVDAVIVAGAEAAPLVSVALGDGAFGFPETPVVSVGSLLPSATIGAIDDFSGDARPDLLVRAMGPGGGHQLVVYVALD